MKNKLRGLFILLIVAILLASCSKAPDTPKTGGTSPDTKTEAKADEKPKEEKKEIPPSIYPYIEWDEKSLCAIIDLYGSDIHSEKFAEIEKDVDLRLSSIAICSSRYGLNYTSDNEVHASLAKLEKNASVVQPIAADFDFLIIPRYEDTKISVFKGQGVEFDKSGKVKKYDKASDNIYTGSNMVRLGVHEFEDTRLFDKVQYTIFVRVEHGGTKYDFVPNIMYYQEESSEVVVKEMDKIKDKYFDKYVKNITKSGITWDESMDKPVKLPDDFAFTEFACRILTQVYPLEKIEVFAEMDQSVNSAKFSSKNSEFWFAIKTVFTEMGWFLENDASNFPKYKPSKNIDTKLSYGTEDEAYSEKYVKMVARALYGDIEDKLPEIAKESADFVEFDKQAKTYTFNKEGYISQGARILDFVDHKNGKYSVVYLSQMRYDDNMFYQDEPGRQNDGSNFDFRYVIFEIEKDKSENTISPYRIIDMKIRQFDSPYKFESRCGT